MGWLNLSEYPFLIVVNEKDYYKISLQTDLK